jgi:D-lyxose ketol-isomerase
MNSHELQERFVRDLEARYAETICVLRAAGVAPERAHQAALEDVKEFGRQVLDELTRRRLFPWPTNAAFEEPRDVG